MAELVVLSPDGAERRVALEGKPVLFGRADDCGVVLAEPKASRKHCRVEPKGGGWRVVDEGSANGTWLGGKPVLAARLSPGDELEIGETIITFVDESVVAAAPREPRRPRVRRKSTPWAALIFPVLAAVGAFVFVRQHGWAEEYDASASLVRYAKSEIERAALQKDPSARGPALASARAALERVRHSDEALLLVDEAIAGPAPTDKAATDSSVPKEDWRADLEQFDADKTATPSQRRARLTELTARHVDKADACSAIRDRIKAELTSSGDRVRIDREQTFAEADAALADGRIGYALSRWTTWIKSAQSISAEDDAAIAQRLSSIVEKSGAAAKEAAAQYEAARAEGRLEAAESALSAAIERLRGTGFDVWLAARGGGVTTGRPGGPTAGKVDDAAKREQARALQLSTAGETLARQRRFVEAAAKIDEAAAVLSDASGKKDVAARAVDLRAEAAFETKLLEAVAADPKKFSPLKMGERVTRVAAASAAEVSIIGADGAPESHSVADLPSPVFVQFVEKAALDKADFVAAALFLRDLMEQDAYTKWMRAALALDDLRVAASEVHARCVGRAVPTGGFMPHPDDGRTIVTFDEWRAIKNAVKIAALRVDLLKIVDHVEKSKQAKQVESVRRAYAKLEEARAHARELIFDEVRYFYPYRNRMKEYAPVQREVSDRVKLVRDAWEDGTSAKVRTDSAMEKFLSDADKIVTDIQYYGGDPADILARIATVRPYIGKDLTVQTFFETQADVDLMAYNAKVLKYNPSVKGPSEPEREQVKITNEYRIMFGHIRALRIHPNLVASAHGHSEDMSKLGFFDHFNPFNPAKHAPEDRMKLAGYPIAGGSENIYQGSGSPESAHEGWIHSSGHHRNILTPAWIEMGSGNFGACWTQNFGFRYDDDWEGGVPK